MDGNIIKPSLPEIVTNFFGVYLLHCVNPQYFGRTYIGYTRDPNRRLMQHNRGTWAGGAHKTNEKGPWKMVLIVHGFPNNIAALRFEWAWQNPSKTTRLHHVEHRKKLPRREKELEFRLRILAEMLLSGPWHRLPLTIRWLEEVYFTPFPIDKQPPDHMIVKHGPVKSKNKTKKSKELAQTSPNLCSICFLIISSESSQLKCINGKCGSYFHVTCLGAVFLKNCEYVPVDGNCPKCGLNILWGDLIHNMGGSDDLTCLNDVSEDDLSQECDAEEESDES